MLALCGLPAFAAGDAARGAQAVRPCLACHSVRPGEHLTGPSLAHVYGRQAASAPGFRRYSDALKRSGLVWNAATLDKWLADPAALVPGNGMTFPGLRDPQARQDAIAYLQTLQGGGASGKPRKPELRGAPPQGQVRSIRRCGDTYTVETADGRAEKIWEFNLRFKTDSSETGPAPGKPVVIGAGMQGDRASIVFASPKEISESIEESCP